MLSTGNTLLNNNLINNEVVFKHLGEYQPIISDKIQVNVINNETITETFLQQSHVEIISKSFQDSYQDWMVYTLLILMFGISVVWYYFPERALAIFKIRESKKEQRINFSTGSETPGMIILFFFIINYLLTISLFFYLSSSKLDLIKSNNIIDQEILWYFILGAFVFYIFRLVIIFITGFIFNTREVSQKQLNIYINIDNIIGVLLIPLLLLILFVQVDFVIYAGIGIILILQIIKWFQTFILANSVPGFSALHLFMYLCALEILPVIVLIKLFNNEFV